MATKWMSITKDAWEEQLKEAAPVYTGVLQKPEYDLVAWNGHAFKRPKKVRLEPMDFELLNNQIDEVYAELQQGVPFSSEHARVLCMVIRVGESMLKETASSNAYLNEMSEYYEKYIISKPLKTLSEFRQAMDADMMNILRQGSPEPFLGMACCVVNLLRKRYEIEVAYAREQALKPLPRTVPDRCEITSSYQAAIPNARVPGYSISHRDPEAENSRLPKPTPTVGSILKRLLNVR